MEEAKKFVAGLIVITGMACFLGSILGLLGIINWFSKIIFAVGLSGIVLVTVCVTMINKLSQ